MICVRCFGFCVITKEDGTVEGLIMKEDMHDAMRCGCVLVQINQGV